MSSEMKKPRYGLIVLAILSAWTLFALFFSTQLYLNIIYHGRSQPFSLILIPWLTCGYLWAALTPVALWLARRFPLDKEVIVRRVAMHLVFGVLISLLQLVAYNFVFQTLVRRNSDSFFPLGPFQDVVVGQFHFNLLLYSVIVGLYQTFDYYRRFREREQRAAQLELEAAQLETQLTRAQLDALKMQLHPHFLFNTLNTISVLMEEDVAAANEMLLRLSDLLRAALKNNETHEVTLSEELQFLEKYLQIEQARFQDRLKVRIDPAPETLAAYLPNLLLQPLVENAIRHAVAPRATETLIEIRSRKLDGHLHLSVSDNGEGIIDHATPTNGIGLRNTRARLEKLYGSDQDFRLETAAGGGVNVSITIPFHTEDDDGSN
ncbi:MAG TPA: histidine kinase [Pyrinomonadaceae bacterium]|jgi:sensor histidine kinase YesM|nr:histidine kinase [Pyrinomonadaceae bacterium]